MKATIQHILDQNKVMVIDGSMGTALENLGANLNCNLWTAQALANTPELVSQVHLQYFRAGADCGITCSYQATFQGLMANGFSEKEAEELIIRSVTIFKETRDKWWEEEGKDAGRVYPLCLAGIGPYGAYLADGSEYRGNYGISDKELYTFHRRRMELLWNAGADVLLIETQPSLKEVLVETQIAEELGADYWVSFSCKDGLHINEGELLRDCAKELSQGHPHLKMLGVNCTKPEYIRSLIAECRKGTTLPIAVYPNSGEEYDPTTKNWHGAKDAMDFGEYALSYFKAGASAVGGCCTTVEKHIRQVVEAKEKFMEEGAKVHMI